MELTLEWPSTVISLEALRPLSPEIQYEQIKQVTAVDKLSRSELAGKLLDQFDEQQQDESEPFDWFSDERSVDIPFFESLPSPPFPYKTEIKPIPPLQPTYPFTCAFDSTTRDNSNSFNAATYPEDQQQSASTLPTSVYNSPASPLLYASVAQYRQSPTPVAPLAPQPSSPSASHPSAYDALGDVKIECDPQSLSATSCAEWLKRETLTPPESPKDEDILKMLEEIEPGALERLVMEGAQELDESSTQQAATFAETISRCDLRADDQLAASYSDDCAASYRSSRSGSLSPYTTSDGGLDDPEWIPPSCGSNSIASRRRSSVSTKSNRSSSNSRRTATSYAGAKCKSAGGTAAAARRRADKPYAKPGTEERRQRKKEQNKNAATRYRGKKKAEAEEVRQQEQELIDRNDILRKELEEISREARYLKSLLRDVYRKKGLIK